MRIRNIYILLTAFLLLQFIAIYFWSQEHNKYATTKQNSIELSQRSTKNPFQGLIMTNAEQEIPVELIENINGSGFTSYQHTDHVIPILLIACNRITVNRTLQQLLSYRKLIDPERKIFPIYVSRDCDSDDVRILLNNYKNEIVHLQHPMSPPPVVSKRDKGYAMIARHFKWAFDQVFVHFNHQLAIVVEDDLDISLDFFEYFAALAPLLLSDQSLYCVSGWNDNGKAPLIDVSRPDLLYRSDFFPGLGWMLTQTLWKELSPKWPFAYWDEFMRLPEIRLGRACIRPEISRTHTFGRSGISSGQFYDAHLQFNYLNPNPIKFESDKLLINLKSEVYDAEFKRRVYEFSIPINMNNMTNMNSKNAYRWEYHSKKEFLNAANLFGIMKDFKYGVPRTAYLGIVSIFSKGVRIYLAPRREWKQYDLSWT